MVLIRYVPSVEIRDWKFSKNNNLTLKKKIFSNSDPNTL